MDIRWSAQALKTLRRMPRDESQRVRAKITQYAQEPRSLANAVQQLQGRGGYRLRLGDWRVLFTVDGQVLSVVRVGPRGEVYK